jgi:hypothetical protein
MILVSFGVAHMADTVIKATLPRRLSMKIILTLLAVVLLSTGPMAMAVEDRLGGPVYEVKKEKKPKEEKPTVPCACVCAGTLPGTKWSCSPTACSPRDGTNCAAGGPSQSPLGSQTLTP